MTATTVIALRARLKTEKLYKKVTDNLYEIYHSSGNNITDGEWEEFLKNFDPTDYKRLFKESERKPEE